MLRRLIILLPFVLLFGCTSTSSAPEGSIRLNFVKGKQLPSLPDSLLPIFPNPFNRASGDTSLSVQFNIKQTTTAILLIQNALGDEIAGFSDTALAPGFYSGHWNPIGSDGARLNSGLYFVTLRTNSYIDSRLVNIQTNE